VIRDVARRFFEKGRSRPCQSMRRAQSRGLSGDRTGQILIKDLAVPPSTGLKAGVLPLYRDGERRTGTTRFQPGLPPKSRLPVSALAIPNPYTISPPLHHGILPHPYRLAPFFPVQFIPRPHLIFPSPRAHAPLFQPSPFHFHPLFLPSSTPPLPTSLLILPSANPHPFSRNQQIARPCLTAREREETLHRFLSWA